MNFEESFEEKLRKLQERFHEIGVDRRPSFNQSVVKDWCFGIDESISAILAFIQRFGNFYKGIVCKFYIEESFIFAVNNDVRFPNLFRVIEDIQPGVFIRFEYSLSDSYIAELGDISESISIYFEKYDYRVVYEFGSKQLVEFSIPYKTYLDKEQIKRLRDTISESIFRKISIRIEKLT